VLAVPAKGDLARSGRLMTELFAAELADHSIPGRRALCRKLLSEASKYDANPVDKFVLLGGAMAAGEEGGDLAACFSAADQLAAGFQVDALRLKADAALKTPLSGYASNPTVNVKTGMEILDQLISAEDFATAVRLTGLWHPFASNDPDLSRQLQRRGRDLGVMRSAHDRAAAQMEKLKREPNDPGANFDVGWYHCLVMEHWRLGLPMLAKGSDPVLRDLAGSELARPGSPDRIALVGDGWWDVGQKQSGMIHDHACRHAASVYAGARGSASGLQRALIEKRLVEAAAMEGRVGPEVDGSPESAFTNTLGMKFVRIDPGTFTMGSPPGEAGRKADEAQHKVTLTGAYYIETTLVTQEQWKSVMGHNISRFQDERNPVERVSWRDAVVFCEKLSKTESKRYRLPTEAEWEYACRAGSADAYGAADPEEVGWYRSNSQGSTHPVGQKRPNAWGLYDMHGNVLEWCSDVYGAYPPGEAVDPKGPEGDENAKRVVRSGSWYEGGQSARSANRSYSPPDKGTDRHGLRICCDP
jgi:formylglycine-generating enzyme required for sulfatase activity